MEEILEIPSGYINSYLNMNEEIGNQFCKKCGRALYLTLKGVIKHGTSITKDVEKLKEIVYMFYNDECSNNIIENYYNLLDSYNSLVKEIGKLNNRFEIIENKPSCLGGVNEKSKKAIKNSDLLPKKTDLEREWSDKITKMTKEKAAKNEMNISTLMKKIYMIMKTEYGVVFEQDKKDIRNLYNLDDDAHISTLYVVVTNDKYRSIYQSILETRY